MEEKKYSVSEITELIKRSLEEGFNKVSVEGELSNCKPSSTGHFYFTLKDAGASLSGVMFKNSLRGLSFTPKDGNLVKVSGRISVYALRGSYQMIGERMKLAGEGDILAMLERRKRQLAEEGLFDEARKGPIPRFPETVGIVSSPTGAAIRDILNVLSRRAAGLRIVVLPTPVQGGEAAPIIARRIEQANQWNIADVLIVGRGGGSLEDLLPFSEDIVVRAVAASKIPVISAVGHEIDWALCDFASDLRAPTPSAAAELVSENRSETLAAVRAFTENMKNSVHSRLERSRLLIKPFKIDNLEQRFRAILQPRLLMFDDAKENLLEAAKYRITEFRRRIELSRNSLEAANPLAILERGFSVVVNTATGKIIRSAKGLNTGDILTIRPQEGELQAKVIS